MPRTSGARKNQHNNRHENGLVGPGKRITKQKSNGHLNGSAKGAALNDSPLDHSNTPISVTPPATSIGLSTQSDSKVDSNSKSSLPALRTRDSGSSYDGHQQENEKKWENTNGKPMAVHRRSDAQANKSKPTQDVNAIQIASTILRSRPAYDTIALLIVLLALPSMILTLVQALFASLTLMPGAGFTSVSFLSLFDVFQGSAGAPSLGVMAWVDGICFGLWILLWNWAQNFALDLAQIHIAITLGNGSSGKTSGANSICFAIVLLLHTIRSRGVRKFVMSNLVPTDLISQTRLGDYVQYLPSESELGDTPGPPSKLRSLFAIHIISQALISFVRRRIASSQSSATAKATKRIDTESGMPAGQDVVQNDTSTTALSASGTDYQPPPTPTTRDPKDRGLSAKKRRRQANHVRSRQPFWAALASTKVHVLREVENSKGLPSVPNNQNGPFDTPQQDSVWVTNVDPFSIQCEARLNFYMEHDDEGTFGKCKPFIVRINGARWTSVCIEPLRSQKEEEGQAEWSGEISGLAPDCTYTCSFIRTDDDEEFASVMVKTPAMLDKDLPPSLGPPTARQSTRPSSPTTTLKNSINSAESKLVDARKRLSQVKRQHKAALNKVDREVDALGGRLKSGADDTKLRQKLLQTERSMRQTEDSTSSIMSAIETLETVPEDESVEHSSKKASYEERKAQLAEANEILAKAKSAADNDLSAVNGELGTITSKKERLTTKQTKLNEQHDRITQANAQGMNERERRAAESAAKESDQRRREMELLNHIRALENQLQDVRHRRDVSWRELEAVEKQERQQMMITSGPLTPEGELPGTGRGQPQHARPHAFGSFNTLPAASNAELQSSPFLAYANTLPSDLRRPRSSTNQSLGANSNFSAEFEDADPIPPMMSNAEYDVNGRKGSGSSRGKNNGSPAAGVIGGGIRSPQRGSNSPGHIPGTMTW